MKLAERTGLPVPPAHLRYVPEPVYLIDRFDRDTAKGETHKLHAIDACQLLGLDRTFKYRQTTVEALVQGIEQCRTPARARQQLLQWVIFNLLTGNADAHLKNLSFLVKADGIELARFYDLVSTECHRAGPDTQPRWPNRELGLSMADATTFAAVTPQHILTFAERLGTNRRAAARTLAQLTAAIAPAADTLMAEFKAMAIPRTIRAGQLRVLRQIRRIAIRDMLAHGSHAAVNGRR